MMSDLEASYRYCRGVVRRASSNLASTFWLLPGAQRRGMDALYAFARQADDFADGDAPVEVRRSQLTQFHQAVASRLVPYDDEAFIARKPFASAPSTAFSYSLAGPLALLPALEDTVRRFRIPPRHLLDNLRGVAMDLDHAGYETFDELVDYCHYVASAVGLACLPIWGCDDPAAERPAIDCGIAFQLANILRDLLEDAQRGRRYLPREELARFGADEAMTNLAAWGELIQFQTARAGSFFESGSVTRRFLPKPGRRVFDLMLARYRAILAQIARQESAALRQRVQLSFPNKLVIAGRTLSRSLMDFATAVPHHQTAATDHSLPLGPVCSPTVAVIGGGLAGLAAAAALCERGCRVEMFEAKRRLGGRAGSFVDPQTGEQIDHCQHVAMGCCTNFLAFCRQTGIADLLSRHQNLHFFGPDGQRCDFAATNWLPPPLHLAPAFAGLQYLSRREQASIAAALMRLARLSTPDSPASPSIGQWLQSQSQSPRSIERFWQVILVSALGESLEYASLSAARKVFVDGFLAAASASDVLIPKVSLGELYDGRVADWLRKRGVLIHLDTPLQQLEGDAQRVQNIILGDGSRRKFDAFILAMTWRQLEKLLSPQLQGALVSMFVVARDMASAPITSLHLWMDRPITNLPHAVLVGRLSQWVFATGERKSPAAKGFADPLSGSPAYHYQVVISASHDLAGRQRDDVLREVRTDLETIFPEARSARILQWRMITEHDAVFSVRPGLDLLRPAQATSISNLFLAGDWTATGWPATMEGAVRSGNLAAEAVLRSYDRENRILAADLPRGLLARLLIASR